MRFTSNYRYPASNSNCEGALASHKFSALEMPKRKSLSKATDETAFTIAPIPVPTFDDNSAPPPKRRASQRKISKVEPNIVSTNPDKNADVLDAPGALRASPDADEPDERIDLEKAGMDVEKQVKEEDNDSPLSEVSDVESPIKSKPPSAIKQGVKKGSKVTPNTNAKEKTETTKEPQFLDPEAEGDEEADEEEIQAALSRPPPVNTNFLPLPWKGRLGYVCNSIPLEIRLTHIQQACLCTYLRFSNPPVFSSRTCRIASILENRHPLKFPEEPPHATKNRPDREKPAELARGQAFVEALGIANAKDIVKMLRWNDRYGIKFLRLSSEMFPFASHEEYGYKLAPFVSKELAEAGKVAVELGHRLTTHPGQVSRESKFQPRRTNMAPVHTTGVATKTGY